MRCCDSYMQLACLNQQSWFLCMHAHTKSFWCLYVVRMYPLQHICGTQFNRPSTPQFGQPSRVAPAGRAPRAQWKKKRSKVTGGVEICPSVCNAPKGKKLGVRKQGIIKQGKIRFWYILIPIVQKGKKFVTFALVSTYGTTMDLHKEGVYRKGR